MAADRTQRVSSSHSAVFALFLIAGGAFWTLRHERAVVAGAVSGDARQASTAERIRLKAPITFHVSPKGSDDADGLTASTAWRTLQIAYDRVRAQYDLAGQVVTFQLADGTYIINGGTMLACDGPMVGQVSDIVFLGNPARPENVILKGTGEVNRIFEVMNTRINVNGMTLEGINSTTGLLGYFYGRLSFANLVFGPMGTGKHIEASGGIVIAQTDYRITGGAAMHMLSITPGSRIDITARTVTVLNSPRFEYFAEAQNLGFISAYNKFSGNASGARYYVSKHAVIETGGGENQFPGDAPGVRASNGYFGA